MTKALRPGQNLLPRLRSSARFLGCALLCLPLALPSLPLAAAEVSLSAGDGELAKALRGASLSVQAEADGIEDAQELIAAAQADYRRLLAALYERGYFSGAISIRIDGREASRVSALDRDAQVGRIEIEVTPGPRFSFGEARVAPVPEGTVLPEGFATGQPAGTIVMRQAAEAGRTAWAEQGHAKARISSQQITANHGTEKVDAAFAISPGPRLTFGTVTLSEAATQSAVRPERIRQIAGIPEGEVYSPTEIARAETRLRQAGAFASAVVTEAEEIGPGDTLPTRIEVQDAKPRRLGAGAEYSTTDGLTLSGYWLHRNLRGGAERLRFDAEIAGLGGGTGGIDYALSTSYTYPAFRNPDRSLVFGLNLAREDEPNYISDIAEVNVGVDRYITETLSADYDLGLRISQTEDASGTRDFTHLTLSTGLTWDNRDDGTNPTDGAYAEVELMPFAGLSGTASGLRASADLRGYRGFADDRFVLAGRLQLGMLAGPSIAETPADWLFWSGGGDSVRGQGYQSLGVGSGPTATGGRGFAAISTELRARIGESWGAAAFVDYGYVSADPDLSGGEWQGGAGLGIRYYTSIGPIRADIAVPVTGATDSVSVYVGIGQSF
ncbi:autotransporter secretion outer membrane protein TamA [Pseudooceanicola antarcticus]|uniref:Autotransporter secretion outer membrane protein TamA n=1 Tax=Pseudooceanicola antarcticus TaxID=1247613 RepID=A0A285IL24_9RHOB|nr:autotransporter assembly complex family protein [Pseudooceanicola antarcticus]PJE28642.1 outer membrane protein assembly factor [Pseudooceanicola antarcticus]SNY48672.1 autotransporter secretion outer membrane protein TamA [Pseudooceanicola antarcticus]